jgi:hypothetical protein
VDGNLLFSFGVFCQAEASGLETLNYGVTFQDPKKHAKELQQLDKLLAEYSSFSSPKTVQGDQQQEGLAEKTKEYGGEGRQPWWQSGFQGTTRC